MVYKGVDRITPRDGTGDNERLNRRYKRKVIKRPTSRQYTPSIECPIDVMCCLGFYKIGHFARISMSILRQVQRAK
ncbi:hypothetical protein ALC56_03661 [Trachymyrmex septentrionalis]|uniref:Uncharacterized protein n=1 Tax=Trachymyrmex septentrionalis TaxID=34720 RepID=A0A151JZI1_9HYME|nr:hypothetical protein ALC56_03661 [Trachymyrmex septentrionalis]